MTATPIDHAPEAPAVFELAASLFTFAAGFAWLPSMTAHDPPAPPAV